MDAGYYRLQVNLEVYSDTGFPGIIGKREAVHIYQNMTTVADWTFTEDDFPIDGGGGNTFIVENADQWANAISDITAAEAGNYTREVDGSEWT